MTNASIFVKVYPNRISVDAADTAELTEENRKMSRTVREVPVTERGVCRRNSEHLKYNLRWYREKSPLYC